MCIRIYIFNFRKQTNKQKKHEYKKAKAKEKKMWHIGWKFFSSPTFPGKRVFFFWPNQQNLLQNCIYEEKVIINNDLNDLMSEKTFENQ